MDNKEIQIYCEKLEKMLIFHERFDAKNCCEYCDCLNRDYCKKDKIALKKCELIVKCKIEYRTNQTSDFGYDFDHFYDYCHITFVFTGSDKFLENMNEITKITHQTKQKYNKKERIILFKKESFPIDYVRFGFKLVEKPEFLLCHSKHIAEKVRVLIIKNESVFVAIAPRLDKHL